jgi:hypothetical protein
MSRRSVIKRAKIARGRRLAFSAWYNRVSDLLGDGRILVDAFTARAARRILRGIGE